MRQWLERAAWPVGGVTVVLLFVAAALSSGSRGIEDVGVVPSTTVGSEGGQPATEPILAPSGPTTTDEDLLLSALRGDFETTIGDSYGGVWLDEDRDLRVGATTAEAAAELEELGVAAEVVEFSESDLNAAVGLLNDGAETLSGGSTGWFVDLLQNRVVIETDDEAAILPALASLGVDPAMVVFESAVERFHAAELDSSEYWTVPAIGQCSFGFGVNGGFITAGHCIPDDWSGDLELSATVRGRVVHDIETEYTDAAFVAVDAPYAVGPGVPDGRGGTTPVLGFEEAPVGAQVCKYGRRTGQTCGVVRTRNQTISTGTSIYTGQMMTTACARPGDSGGRLMWGSQAQGVTSTGRLAECGPNGEGQSTFQPIKPLLAHWNLQLAVQGSFLPPPDPVVPSPDPGVPVLPGANPGGDDGGIPVLPGANPGGDDGGIPVLPGANPGGDDGGIPVLPGANPGGDDGGIPVLPGANPGGDDGGIPVLPGANPGGDDGGIPVLPGANPGGDDGGIPVLPGAGTPLGNPTSTVPSPPPTTPVPTLPAPPPTNPTTPSLPGFFTQPGPFQLESFIPIRDCVTVSGSNVVLARGESCRPEVHALLRIGRPADGLGHLITNEQRTMCWTVEGGSNVAMSPCNDGVDQRFTIEEVPFVGGYRIRALTDGRCVEIHTGENGSDIVVFGCLADHHTHQRWGSYHYPHLD